KCSSVTSRLSVFRLTVPPQTSQFPVFLVVGLGPKRGQIYFGKRDWEKGREKGTDLFFLL
ncbi:hypothetical protein, partial [Pseudomonas sp. NBRC 111135]|uniref:hypothetical protein n=1 Tax=Pseudomonas sp. NBRC 111135 TaxID=1661050 RepID=UPI001C46B53A